MLYSANNDSAHLEPADVDGIAASRARVGIIHFDNQRMPLEARNDDSELDSFDRIIAAPKVKKPGSPEQRKERITSTIKHLIGQLEKTKHSDALPELQDIKEIFARKTEAEIAAIGDQVISALNRKKVLQEQQAQRKTLSKINLEIDPTKANEVVQPLLNNKSHVAVPKDYYVLQSSYSDPNLIKPGDKQSKYIFDLGLKRESKIQEYMRAANAAAIYAEQ